MSPVKLVAKYEHHCEHGTYIGGPLGADLLCGACEDGISDEKWFDNKVWDWTEEFERAAHLDVLKEKLLASGEWTDWVTKHPECQDQTTPELLRQFLQWCDQYGLDEQEKQQKLGLLLGWSHRKRNERSWEYIGKRDRRESELRARYEAREAVLRERHQAQLKTLIEEKEQLKERLRQAKLVFEQAVDDCVKHECELELERNLGQNDMQEVSEELAVWREHQRQDWNDRWQLAMNGQPEPPPHLVNGEQQY